MSSFTKHPPLQPLPDGQRWQVVEDFEYHIGSEDSPEIVKIPKGFISDGASIPKIFWSLIGGPWGRYGYAAILHDYVYYEQLFPRKKCDEIFYEAMKILGVPWWKRKVIYFAVRAFAFKPWNKYKARKVAEEKNT